MIILILIYGEKMNEHCIWTKVKDFDGSLLFVRPGCMVGQRLELPRTEKCPNCGKRIKIIDEDLVVDGQEDPQ